MKQYLYRLAIQISVCICLYAVTVSPLFSQANRTNWYNDYDVTHYLIDLNVSDTSKFISGNTYITAQVTKAGLDSFYCELIDELRVDSVFVDVTKAQFAKSKGIIKVKLGKPYSVGESVTVGIYYQGTVPKNTFFSSFTIGRDQTWDIPVAWTLSEPFGANQWFPCKQYLPDKADSAQINITVPSNRMAGSNGLLTRIVPLEGNLTRYEWKTNYPTAYYLLSFTVADYKDYSFYAKVNAVDSVLVQNFIFNRPGYLESNKAAIDKTADFIGCFSRLFGDYPFKKEKYGHCVAPIGGGMEHQTMTTIQNFGYNLVSHELAHMWFGNYVTCDNWQDIWINEGFASYAEYLAIDSLISHESAVSWMKEAHGLAFMSNASVYVPVESATDENRIFSYYTTYKKGASIIHALRYELNDDPLFFNILRTYLARFAFKNATAKDFIQVVNERSGADYNWFFDQWYYGKGYPLYDISWKQNGDSVFMTSVQTPVTPEAGLFVMHYDVKLKFADGDTVFRVFQDAAEKVFAFKVGKRVSEMQINPNENALMKVINVSPVIEIPSFDDFMKVTPNPFRDEFTITFLNEPLQDMLIKVITMDGQEIASMKGRKRHEIKVSMKDDPTGVYMLYVICGNRKYVRKLIKTRW